MTDNTTRTLSVLPPSSRRSLNASTAKELHQEIRRNAAIAAGVEAMALMAFDQGEATPDQIEHLLGLATLMRKDLEQLAIAVAEVAATSARAK